MRIPFDSLCLSAIVRELQPFAGARVQRWVQTGPLTVQVQLYAGAEGWLLLSADPENARIHFMTRRPTSDGEPPAFLKELRKRLTNVRLTGVRQVGLDRVLHLDFSTPEGDHRLVAELMGKHSNLMLLGPDERVVAAAKWVGPTKSKRPILPNHAYAQPPTPPRRPLTSAVEGDDLREFEGASPFLVRWIEANSLQAAQSAFEGHGIGAYHAIGHGAYPLPLDSIGLEALSRSSLSLALELHYAEVEGRRDTDRARQALRSQLSRVLLAREVALHEMRQALDTADHADSIQLHGQLILAYQGQIRPGDTELHAWDYEGREVSIPLNPEKSPVENAERLFEKAKRAKNAAAGLRVQANRYEQEHRDLTTMLADLDAAERAEDVESLRAEAEKRRWLHKAAAQGQGKRAERPYEGHSIRELQAPGGWRVLYGENATSNDYLTLRVAKPSDWWVHVRGSTSAHVILLTGGQPEKVQREALEFAARVAVRQSPSKHSSYVPVDYTLKRYVRRPKGAHPGTAIYTHEKTLHVDALD